MEASSSSGHSQAIFEKLAYRLLDRDCNGDSWASPEHSDIRLAEDLKVAFGSRDQNSDIVFVCSDGLGVHASRVLVSARSTVLKRMLTNGMAETRASEIPFPSIRSKVLLPIIEFLYTGAFDKLHLDSWEVALEVIRDARFLLLHDLGIENLCLEYLVGKTLVMIDHDDIKTAAKNLSTSMLFATLFEECESLSAIVMELVKLLRERYLDSITLQLLSDEAFHFFLSRTCTKYTRAQAINLGEYLKLGQIIFQCARLDRDYDQVELSDRLVEEDSYLSTRLQPGTLGLSCIILFHFFLSKALRKNAEAIDPDCGEYLKLRHIILWCAGRDQLESNLQEVERELSACLPPGPLALSLIQVPEKLNMYLPPQKAAQVIRSTFLSGIPRESLAGMLAFVDILAIPSGLLTRVIEPLGILSRQEIKAALRIHAPFNQPRVASPSPLKWHYRDNYIRPSARCSRLWCIPVRANETAVASVPISSSYGIYVWDVIIDKAAKHDVWEIGFVRLNMDPFHARKFSQYPYGAARDCPCGMPVSGTVSQQAWGHWDAWSLEVNVGDENDKSRHRICTTSHAGEPRHKLFRNEDDSLPESLPRAGKELRRLIRKNSRRLCQSYGRHKFVTGENSRIRVCLDMFQRNCSFSIEGEDFGVAFSKLPKGMYFPAVSKDLSRSEQKQSLPLLWEQVGNFRIDLVSGFDTLECSHQLQALRSRLPDCNLLRDLPSSRFWVHIVD